MPTLFQPVSARLRPPWYFYAAWVALLLFYTAVAMAHLADYGADYDEGVLLQTAVLAHHGYPLYDPIVLNKPPLLVWWLQLFFAFAGPSLTAARLAVLLLNTMGLAALGALAARWWGRWAGPTAVSLMLLLPETMLRANAVTPDLPAMSLMLLALLAAAGAAHGKRAAHGQRRLVITAGLFFALGLALHPVLLFMALPIALALAVRPDLKGLKTHSAPNLILFSATAVATTLLWLLFVDWPGFHQWVITYNRAPLDATLTAVAARNGQKIIAYLRDQWPLLLLAGSGSLLLLTPPSTKHKGQKTKDKGHPRTGYRLPLTTCLLWLTIALFTLSRLQPMWEHYRILLAYPLLLTAAGGVLTAIKKARAGPGRAGPCLRSSGPLLLCLLSLLCFLVANLTAPRPWAEWPPGYPEALAQLQSETEPGAFILTDEPFLAFAAGLQPAPSLADSSTKRIAVGLLQPTDIFNAQLQYGVQYGLWGNGRFQQLPTLTAWAEATTARQTDLGALTLFHFDVLTPTHPLHARLEPELHLRGYRLHPPPDAHTVHITLFWEAAATPAADYKILLHLLDGHGNLVAQADGDPMAGWLPTSAWKAGIVAPYTAVISLPTLSTPPYTLVTGMYTWPEAARLPAFRPDGSRWANDLVIVGQIADMVE